MEKQRGYPPRAHEAWQGGQYPAGPRQGAGPDEEDFYGGAKRRRRTRSSRSESQVSEDEAIFERFNTGGFGIRSDATWVNRNAYEQANGYYRSRQGQAGGAGRDRVPRTLVFRSKRGSGQQPHSHEDHYYAQTTFTTHPRGTARFRSNSEPRRGRQAPRGNHRRGHLDMDRALRRDNVVMSGVQCLVQDAVWLEKPRYDEAERRYYEGLNGIVNSPQVKVGQQTGKGHTRNQKPRERKTSQTAGSGDNGALITRMKSLELDSRNLHKVMDDLKAVLSKLESRMAALERSPGAVAAHVAKAPVQSVRVVEEDEDDDDEDFDLFGSDEDDDEAERIKAERVREYTERKAKKPALIAKSSILLDVKPWDDETDMAVLEQCVRSVQVDGLLWGGSKLVPVGYGIRKLQIQCVVEDDKVGTDLLEEEITKFEDYVQSVDVAAFNKI